VEKRKPPGSQKTRKSESLDQDGKSAALKANFGKRDPQEEKSCLDLIGRKFGRRSLVRFNLTLRSLGVAPSRRLPDPFCSLQHCQAQVPTGGNPLL
jgi:hypothetical protein